MCKNIRKNAIHIHNKDNVLVACNDFKKGEKLHIEKKEINLLDDVDFAHKIAFLNIKKGEKIIKFGSVIGLATKNIKIGEHVHSHNIKSEYILNV